ncbi:uncharacterized protein MELLADRAFT_55276 [Melampsora larici-populina 98AG31]|uniref:Uncharacterized protein n=1 Tax=Melampsora larici-populina (strain 98AG31 / pathotype 3-4-7) TaxID=747676 RepID=F4RCW1_MELLP|nr:uncharacterized protein MELLADRAFT_55276 [Melampsora larici-populina 98AG31]EGG09919.1 hypothetical protein MELLADRAFT_55276 [Melampsora larici-populina 98AG31]
MRGRDFNKKYYDRLSSPYQINSPAGDSDSDDGDGPLYANRPVHEEDMSDSIDLMAPSEGSDAEDKAINKLYFTSGDFGDLYEESKEDGDYTPGEDEDSEDDGGQNGKNAQVPFDTIGDQPMQE